MEGMMETSSRRGVRQLLKSLSKTRICMERIFMEKKVWEQTVECLT